MTGGVSLVIVILEFYRRLPDGSDPVIVATDERQFEKLKVAAMLCAQGALHNVAFDRRGADGRLVKTARWPCGVYRPREAVADQLRDQTAMVDMRVCEQHEVKLAGREGKRSVIESLQCLGALKHPAIDQKARLRRLEQKAGARHGSSRSAKLH